MTVEHVAEEFLFYANQKGSMELCIVIKYREIGPLMHMYVADVFLL